MRNVVARGPSFGCTAAASEMFFQSGTTSRKSVCIGDEGVSMRKCEVAAPKVEQALAIPNQAREQNGL